MVRLILTVLTLLMVGWGLASSAHEYACGDEVLAGVRAAQILDQPPQGEHTDPCHRGVCHVGHCQHLPLPLQRFAFDNRSSPSLKSAPYLSQSGNLFLRRLERPPIHS